MKFFIILSTLLLSDTFALRYIPKRIPESVILLSDNAAAERLVRDSNTYIAERASLGRFHNPSVNKRDFEDLETRRAEERRHNYLKNKAKREIRRLEMERREKEERERKEKEERDRKESLAYQEKVEKDQIESKEKEERNEISEELVQKRQPAEPQLLAESDSPSSIGKNESGHPHPEEPSVSTRAQARSEAIKRASLNEAPLSKRLQRLPNLSGPKRATA